MSMMSKIHFWSSYETVKYVSIPDRRLAVLRWILLAGIIGYVVVIELLQKGGYLQSFAVTGVVRFSLQQPTQDNCNPSTPGCINAFAPLTTLPYCEQYYKSHRPKGVENHHHHHHQQQQQQIQATVERRKTDRTLPMETKNIVLDAVGNSASLPLVSSLASSQYLGPIYPCQIYEAVNAQLIRENSFVIWTRATTYNQTLVCRSEDQTCPQTYHNDDPDGHGESQPFYIAQAEAFTVLMEHAVTSHSICHSHHPSHYSCSAQAKDYHGRLRSQNTELCQAEYRHNNSFTSERSMTLSAVAPCFIGPNRTQTTGQDFFSINVILQAAGVRLDDCLNDTSQDRNETTTCSSTHRSAGATLLLQVVWSDAVPWRGQVEPYYVYIPQLIGDASYKESLPFYYQPYREARILFRAHGIKMAVLVEGRFSQFQMVNFLITLTTALGLLAVSTVVVDNLMLYVLPNKERYQTAKYETMELTDNPVGTSMSGDNSNMGTTTSSRVENEEVVRDITMSLKVQRDDPTQPRLSESIDGV